jgi:hypothetical protein
MSLATRNPLLKAARNPSRSMAAPTLPTRHLLVHKPTKGFDTLSMQHQPFVPDVASTQNPPVQFPTATSTSVVVHGSESPESQSRMDVDSPAATFGSMLPTAATTDTIMRTLINQRVSADVARAQPVPKPAKKRKRRTCAKCARSECSGSQKASNCRNACQDCGKTTCRGRNSSKPKKPCNTPGLWDK